MASPGKARDRRILWLAGGAGILALALWWSACGAEGMEGPAVDPPGRPGKCGTLASLISTTRAVVAEGLFDAVGPHIERVLVETNQHRELARVALEVWRRTSPGDLLTGLNRMSDAGDLGSMTPAVGDILEYITGSGERFAQPHYELIAVGERVWRYCDPRADFATLRRLLELEVPCASCPEGSLPYVTVVGGATAELLADPAFSEAVKIMEVDDNGQAAVGRDAYHLLLDLVIENLASSSFDWAYVRGLIMDALGRTLTGETRQRFDAVMELIEQLLADEGEILPDLQAFLGCLYDRDPGHGLADLLYDFGIQEPEMSSDLLRRASIAYSGEGGRQVLAYLASVFGLFERDGNTARRFLGATLPLLGEAVSRDLFPALAALRGRGVSSELLATLGKLAEGCR